MKRAPQEFVILCTRAEADGSTTQVVVGPHRGKGHTEAIARVLVDHGWATELAPLSDLAAALGFGS